MVNRIFPAWFVGIPAHREALEAEARTDAQSRRDLIEVIASTRLAAEKHATESGKAIAAAEKHATSAKAAAKTAVDAARLVRGKAYQQTIAYDSTIARAAGQLRNLAPPAVGECIDWIDGELSALRNPGAVVETEAAIGEDSWGHQNYGRTNNLASIRQRLLALQQARRDAEALVLELADDAAIAARLIELRDGLPVASV